MSGFKENIFIGFICWRKGKYENRVEYRKKGRDIVVKVCVWGGGVDSKGDIFLRGGVGLEIRKRNEKRGEGTERIMENSKKLFYRALI